MLRIYYERHAESWIVVRVKSDILRSELLVYLRIRDVHTISNAITVNICGLNKDQTKS
jgi:hypothetical protein